MVKIRANVSETCPSTCRNKHRLDTCVTPSAGQRLTANGQNISFHFFFLHQMDHSTPFPSQPLTGSCEDRHGVIREVSNADVTGNHPMTSGNT